MRRTFGHVGASGQACCMPASALDGLLCRRRTAGMQILWHRGASALAPENTLAAFELAWREGADWVELDGLSCRRGAVVVCDDEVQPRLVGGARDVQH